MHHVQWNRRFDRCMPYLKSAFPLGVAVVLAACANLETINRVSAMTAPTQVRPSSEAAAGTTANDAAALMKPGRAIHLDAQQRLVLTTVRGFCAEPSPDALAVYAAALGASASTASKNSAAASGAIQGAAASIGLRTQSITLMRDSLYRICEADLNGKLSEIQVATLLGRSLDLTAVILATEQLTGAVSANQVALTTNSEASANSMLMANQEALDAAKKRVVAKEKIVTDAEADNQAKAAALATAHTAHEAAKTRHDALVAAGSAAAEAEIAAARTELQSADASEATAQQASTESHRVLQDAKTALADARELRDTIEQTRDAALADTRARGGSGSVFTTPSTPRSMSDGAAQYVATAVQTMVLSVLNKKYLDEPCAAVMLSPVSSTATNDARLTRQQQFEFCQLSMALKKQELNIQEKQADALLQKQQLQLFQQQQYQQ